ncbi:MAG: rod shape-determining protein [Planctomycetota bacterium]
MRLLEWIAGRFSIDMGIDLGTANTLVFVEDGGIVMNEPSVVAVKNGTSEVILRGSAVGKEAYKMQGRAPGSIDVIRPLREGVIADFEITEAMLRYFISSVHGRKRFVRPRLVLAIPYGTTEVQRRAFIDSGERAGAREVFLVEEPIAAGLGAGLNVTEAIGSMVVDVGGGTTEIAVLALGDVVEATCLRVAGDNFDEAITKHIREKYNLLIGPLMSESIKRTIGSAGDLETEFTLEVSGRDFISGRPRRAIVTSDEIRAAMMDPIRHIIAGVQTVLERTPPELSADLTTTGITLAGGGSLLRGFDTVIREELDLEVRIAEEPMSCVARGTGVVLKQLDRMADFLYGSHRDN